MKRKKYYCMRRTKEPQTTHCQCIYYYELNQRYMDISLYDFSDINAKEYIGRQLFQNMSINLLRYMF